MTPDHDRLRQLVLSVEELDEADRRDAAEHLAGCAECRALLARFQEQERSLGPRGELPESLLSEAPTLEPREWPAAEASRMALHEKLRPFSSRAPGGSLRPGWGRPLRWLIPVAAAAVALFWMARPRPALEPSLGVVTAMHIGSMRGDTALGASPDTAWRTGDAFALHVDLVRPGWPVVVHVGPDGGLTLLRPERGDRSPLPAGPQRLGPAEPAREWVLEDPPGREDLIVALSTSAAIDASSLERELRAIGSDSDRAGTLRALEQLIRRRVGPVQWIVLHHR